MNLCWKCNIPTNGSVGAAGLRWSHICQKCKDKEDELYKLKLQNMRVLIDQILKPIDSKDQ